MNSAPRERGVDPASHVGTPQDAAPQAARSPHPSRRLNHRRAQAHAPQPRARTQLERQHRRRVHPQVPLRADRASHRSRARAPPRLAVRNETVGRERLIDQCDQRRDLSGFTCRRPRRQQAEVSRAVHRPLGLGRLASSTSSSRDDDPRRTRASSSVSVDSPCSRNQLKPTATQCLQNAPSRPTGHEHRYDRCPCSARSWTAYASEPWTVAATCPALTRGAPPGRRRSTAHHARRKRPSKHCQPRPVKNTISQSASGHDRGQYDENRTTAAVSRLQLRDEATTVIYYCQESNTSRRRLGPQPIEGPGSPAGRARHVRSLRAQRDAPRSAKAECRRRYSDRGEPIASVDGAQSTVEATCR